MLAPTPPAACIVRSVLRTGLGLSFPVPSRISGMAADLSPKNLLIMHGTDDQEMPDHYSRELYARARQPKELVLYSGGDHDLAQHTGLALDKLYIWSKGLLLVSAKASGR